MWKSYRFFGLSVDIKFYGLHIAKFDITGGRYNLHYDRGDFSIRKR